MPVESATYVSQLNSAYPAGTETKAQGDDHLRIIKAALLTTFPNADLAVDLAGIDSVVNITGNVSKAAGDFFYLPATDYITATATVSLPAVSGVSVNKRRIFRSISTGDVLLTPNGADTIDGLNASLRVPAYTEVEVIATASGWLAARRSHDFVSKITPCGTVTAPQGWSLCDGAAVSRTTYAGLFAVVSTAFGVGDGSTTFNLPDFRRRTPVGSGGTGTATLGNAVGNSGGEETHVLSAAESGIAEHTHGLQRYGSNITGGGVQVMVPSGTSDVTQGVTGGPVPAASAHNTIQPSVVCGFMVKL